MMKAL